MSLHFLLHNLLHNLLLAALISSTTAQTPDPIPSDLTTGFNAKEVQVSFSANAVNGFPSGTTFSKDAVATEPTFALGDSNGITPSTRYTLIMLDTTCPTRTLHYLRSNFKFSFSGGTNIETNTAPLLAYKAPGAFGEQGDQRRYVFLMYTNPQRREFAEMRLPAEGEAFDVKAFQGQNGLRDPVAGVGMVVKLGGTPDCGGLVGSPVPEGSSTAATASRSPAVSVTLRSSVVSVTSTNSTGTETIQSDNTAPTPSTTLLGDEEQSVAPTRTLQSSAFATQSTAVQTDDTEPTSAALVPTLGSVPVIAIGSPTTSGLLEQTANAAPGAYDGLEVFFPSLLTVVGILFW